MKPNAIKPVSMNKINFFLVNSSYQIVIKVPLKNKNNDIRGKTTIQTNSGL